MQDKTTIIEKIACCPERLTNAEIESIAQDAELKELYEGALLVSQALTEVPNFDVEKSLVALHGNMLQAEQKTRSKGLMNKINGGKVAAAIGSISLTVLAAIAAIFFTTQKDNVTPAAIESYVSNEQDMTTSQETKIGKLYYDDAQLSQILSDLCQKYNCVVLYKNSDLQNNRFHLTIPAEASLKQAVDMLNAFDDVKISLQGDSLIVE